MLHEPLEPRCRTFCFLTFWRSLSDSEGLACWCSIFGSSNECFGAAAGSYTKL